MKQTGTATLRTAAALMCASALTTPAFAQSEGDTQVQQGGIAEIVVTAQRREQSLQDVPIAVSALGGDQIAEAGLSNSLAIGDNVPNLEIKTFGGVPNIFIRGVGNNDFNSSSVGPISIYRDDVVVAATGSQMFALFDVDRIEVLRGPQGTLFGKNTTGGAIHYISRQPGDYFEGYARMGYGRFDLFEAEGAVTMPLAEGLSMRASGIVRRRDGERVNLFTGDKAIDVDEAAVRGILRYNPHSDIDVRLSGGTGRDRSDYFHPKPLGTINGANIFGYSDPAPDDWSVLNYNADSRNYSDNAWASLNVSIGLGGGLTLKSITGYDDTEVDNRVDVDGSPVSIDEIKFATQTEQFSQELQLAYSADRLDAIVGLFYFDEKLESQADADLVGELTFEQGGIPLITVASRDNKSYAVFGQASYELTDRLGLTVGGRYTWDEVDATHRAFLVPGYFDDDVPNGPEIDLVPYAELSDTFKAFSWRLAADYDVTDDIMAYASVTKGFKSGTFNIGIITSVAERTKVEPEYLTSYEVGVKSTLFDRRVRFNASAFYYDYTDLQVLSVNQQGNGVPTLGLDNAADATVKGLEVEILAEPVEPLSLGLNFGLLDATYKNYTSGALDPVTGLPRDFSGNRLPNAPKFTLSTYAAYTVPISTELEAGLRAEYNYTGKRYFNNGEDDLVSSGDGHGLVNLRAKLAAQDGGWELAAWAKNVFGEKFLMDATDLRDFGFIPLYYGERPTWGVEAIARF
ncbi:TonB-dependent receptor [Croceicoccus sediminis]|uniref:TonB-dependent receptor n=1 Tax=Croceicoccus sediminis TaxID=2571150 RepID=UPI0011835E0E|nr:TonB-dependent receptor [Croceicoccus sediminis]